MKMRLCTANGKRAMFHCWEQKSEIVPPSPMRDGHQGGIVRYTVAIVEYDDGIVASVPIENLLFLDTKKVMGNLEKQISKWKTFDDISK